LRTPIFVLFSPPGTEFIRQEVNNVVFEKFTRLAAMLDLVWAGTTIFLYRLALLSASNI